jgi:hypothetical protein
MPRKSPPGDGPPRLVRIPGQGRPGPPPGISQAAQRAWRDIVDSAPDGFVDKAAQLLLRRVVAQIVAAERHEARLDRMAEKGGSLEDELLVLKAHRDTTKTIQAGLAALRCTPQARLRSRAVGPAFEKTPSGPRPWEFRSEVIDLEAARGDEPDGGGDDGQPAA